MLEIVCVKASLDNTGIRCDGIFELYDLELDAFLLEDRLCNFQDLRVRCDISAYLENNLL